MSTATQEPPMQQSDIEVVRLHQAKQARPKGRQQIQQHIMKSRYSLFAAMIGTSMVVMFGLMYLNSWAFSHVRWSETRFYMTFIMGAAMAVIMLSFMRGMYNSAKANIAIYIGSLVVFLAALFLVRSQATVQDRSWMKAMIPHHSIAILTSERAQIDDLRVRALADSIIEAQRREIKEMDWLIEDIRENGQANTQADAEARPVPDFESAAHVDGRDQR